MNLATAVALWPTPTASAGGHAGDLHAAVNTGQPYERPRDRRKLWPTPRASANENRQLTPTPSQLAGTHGLSLAAEANTSLPPGVQGGPLNPTWVEWLMGFPAGWTASEGSATPSPRPSANTPADS